MANHLVLLATTGRWSGGRRSTQAQQGGQPLPRQGRDAGVAFSLEETAKQKERHHTQAQGELSFYGSSQMQCKVVLVTFFD